MMLFPTALRLYRFTRERLRSSRNRRELGIQGFSEPHESLILPVAILRPGMIGWRPSRDSSVLRYSTFFDIL